MRYVALFVVQMMAFPLSSAPQLPWIQQSTMSTVVAVLNSIAATNPGANLVLPLLATALVWLAMLATLAILVGTSYHRERHSMTLPVKVSGRSAEHDVCGVASVTTATRVPGFQRRLARSAVLRML